MSRPPPPRSTTIKPCSLDLCPLATLRVPERTVRPRLSVRSRSSQRAWRVNRSRHRSQIDAGIDVSALLATIGTSDGSRPVHDATFHQADRAAWRHPIEARQGSGKESRESFLEWRPLVGGPGRRLWSAESHRGVHRHHRGSVNKLDRGNHSAAWQEPDLFTTEIRAAFRSLR